MTDAVTEAAGSAKVARSEQEVAPSANAQGSDVASSAVPSINVRRLVAGLKVRLQPSISVILLPPPYRAIEPPSFVLAESGLDPK